MPRQVADPTTGPAFTAAVSAITDAFCDPTRRRVYLHARDRGGDGGVTVAEVATAVGVHPNVARHHLDKLAAGGYVEVARGAGSSARRAGRPSKRYVAAAPGTRHEAFDMSVRSDDLVLALLGRALDRLPEGEAEAMAEEVGATYGRAMASGLTGDDVAAGQRSLRSAMQSVADALTAHGFAAHMAAGERDGGLRIINEHCPFGSVATDHPVICAVDRGMVRGMLSALYADD
ncbi:MAG: helix-turn-helix transcriptional regulator, partial [Ilumatobacteraceae bacterium]